MGDKKDYNLVNDEKMEGVSGGGCWFGARFEAPDGHDVGCSQAYYRVQFSDTEFCNKFPSICPIDGKPHDSSGRQYCGEGKYFITCTKCGHHLNKEGNYDGGRSTVAD